MPKAVLPMTAEGHSVKANRAVRRRGLLTLGALITGVSAVSGLGSNRANAAQSAQNLPNAYVPIAEKGVASGVATLDDQCKIPAEQIPDLSASVARRLTQLQKPTLGPLLAGYVSRTTEPIGIVGLGSSTTAAENVEIKSRYFSLLIKKLQATYPSGSGTESEVGTNSDGAKRTRPGIHGYNFGVSGTTSADYLTDSKVTMIGALNPRAVTHMVGSNDFAYMVPLGTYKANLVAWINKLRSSIPGPCVHILIHAHERYDYPTPRRHTWDEYRNILQEISAENPRDVVLFDVSEQYRAVGIPSSDPLALMRDDRIHLRESGHLLMANLLAPMLGAASLAAPAVPVANPVHRLVYDDFRRPDASTLGTATTGQDWLIASGTYGIAGNRARVTLGGTALIEAGVKDMDVSAVIANPTVQTCGIIVRAIDDGTRMGLFMDVHGSAQLWIKYGTVNAYFAVGTAVGLRTSANIFRVRSVGDTVEGYVNGVRLINYTLTAEQSAALNTSSNTKAGIRCGVKDSLIGWAEFSVTSI